jgi:hypothetical protein
MFRTLTIAFFCLAAGAVHAQGCGDTGNCCGKSGKLAMNTADMEDAKFMAEAERMTLAAEGKSACCKSTATKTVAKGGKGCCNAKEAPKPFKVFVRGEGYRFFGCGGSAAKARTEMRTAGRVVGPVQRRSAR